MHATIRLRGIVTQRSSSGPASTIADIDTSVADARAAICIAAGVSIDDIDGLGYNRSVAAYRRFLADADKLIADTGDECYADGHRAWARRIRSDWLKTRPDVVRKVEAELNLNTAEAPLMPDLVHLTLPGAEGVRHG